MEEYILEMKNITKIYANGFIANKGVNLAVKAKEIHALVGENGAGKSTLMKILFGVEKSEEGEILIGGKIVHIENPMVAIKYGIGMVHQHFMLVPSLTVAENMILGIEPKKLGFLDIKNVIKMTEDVSKKYNLSVDPVAKVADLSVGIKQKVEILKALMRGAKILILDEPTAVLTPQETKELFRELVGLKEQGHTVIFISHKLHEIKEISARVTILRNGRSVGVEEIKNVTERDISRLMVGRDVIMKVEKKAAKPGPIVFSISNLSLENEEGKQILNNISFSIREGEILGIAGVEGNGQREISELVTGLAKYTQGTIKIRNQDIKNLSIKQIRELGTSHISEDRMTYGVVSNATIMENIISDRYYKREYNNGLLFNFKKMKNMTSKYIEEFSIKCDDYSQPLRMLSGGNMQKVVTAREFTSEPKLIVANQPTRGIDVGATEFIRKRLVTLREQGVAVLLISADLNEVLEVSDSIIVMCNGEIVAYFPDTASVSEEELGLYMLGLKRMDNDSIKAVTHER